MRPPATAKQRRTLERRKARVAERWAALPDPKPTALTPGTLESLMGLDMLRLAPALHALGWTRLLRRVNGRPVTLWLPPGSPVSRRPVGRPSVAALVLSAFDD